MMLPGAIAILSPLIIGFVLGPEALGGFLAGATVCGVLMGMFQNNAGGAWDNAKKSFEKGVEINGVMYYKKSEPHKASVTGDTVGDPFKDTSGPSMNILIKLMSIVSLVIAPTLAQIHHTRAEQITGFTEKKEEMKITAFENEKNPRALNTYLENKNVGIPFEALLTAPRKDKAMDGDYHSIQTRKAYPATNGGN
jgi:K(+)-stimulated pyrophosphate-energized sodium pump